MKKALLIVLLFVILQGLSGVIVTGLTMVTEGKASLGNIAVLSHSTSYIWMLGTSLFVCDLLMIVVAYFLLRQNDNNPFRSYLGCAKGEHVGLTIVTLILVMFWANAFTEMMNPPDVLGPYAEGMIHNPICVLSICIVGPIAEEVVFRHGVLGELHKSTIFKRYALILSALFFALIHMNLAQMPGAFILGLLFGWLYLRTHSLVLPILCHILNNTSSVVLSLITSTETKEADLFSSNTLFYATIAITIILTFIMLYVLNKKLPKAKCSEDTEYKSLPLT